ncbi:hypothetical protein BDY19DRAFT_908621 [Irpex rosettiformis]|uniref:Uncharacterized protein n=1 Tax=Irpex rosettiformis TaxID=378272 RepID=A0ACB8TVZ5_9APHY|nr:hypothetical protein BDY19DRAFT_908621 [Irpex rosettiformis]
MSDVTEVAFNDIFTADDEDAGDVAKYYSTAPERKKLKHLETDCQQLTRLRHSNLLAVLAVKLVLAGGGGTSRLRTLHEKRPAVSLKDVLEDCDFLKKVRTMPGPSKRVKLFHVAYYVQLLDMNRSEPFSTNSYGYRRGLCTSREGIAFFPQCYSRAVRDIRATIQFAIAISVQQPIVFKPLSMLCNKQVVFDGICFEVVKIQEIASREYDEKRSSASYTSVEYAANQGTAAPTTLPSLQVLVQYAERAREAGLGSGETFISPPTDLKSVDGVTSGTPDIDEDLISARRALSKSKLAVFYLITTDISGPFNALFAFSQVGYVSGVILYFVMSGVACYTGLILWKLFCAEYYPVQMYADLEERIFGTWFKNLCTVLQSLQFIINVGTICLLKRTKHRPNLRPQRILLLCPNPHLVAFRNYGWFANMAVWLNLLTIFISMGVVAHSPPNFPG